MTFIFAVRVDLQTKLTGTASIKSTIDQKRARLKGYRSNSFDVSVLHGCGSSSKREQLGKDDDSHEINVESSVSRRNSGERTLTSIMSPSTWFAKRHLPMAKKQRTVDLPSGSSFKLDRFRLKSMREALASKTSPTKDEARRDEGSHKHKVVWDDKSGTKVDAQVRTSRKIDPCFFLLQSNHLKRKHLVRNSYRV